MPKVDGVTWRWASLYNLRCDEFWKKNEPCVKKLFDSFLNPTKKYITMEEAFKMCRKAAINAPEYRINACYVESLISKIDTLSDLSVLQ